MNDQKGFSTYNLGNGNGFSVIEVIESCERITERQIDYQIVERREGDPAILIANSNKALSELGWKTRYTTLDSITETAWKWHNDA